MHKKQKIIKNIYIYIYIHLKKLVLPALMEHHQHRQLHPTSQQQLNHQTNKSKEIIKKQQKIIEELMERVGCLEGTVSMMEGELAVVWNVNTLLLCLLDEADSYSWRSCMIVTGLQKPKNDETNEDDRLT